MSRIGQASISINSGITVTPTAGLVTVKGPKGELSQAVPAGITIKVEGDQVIVERKNDQRQTMAFHGLTRSLVANMVEGVEKGYTKKLELVGTGYRAKKSGKGLTITVGFSHPVEFDAPEGITLDTEGDTVIIVTGIDKQLVGQTAAKIRDIRPPEPYKGKGIRYQGEVIRKKAGKAAKVGA